MRKELKLVLLCGILFILIGNTFVLSQNFNVLYDFVGNKQKKVVDKALNEITDAGKLTQEANKYYNEALSLQSNYELDEKTLQKKLAKAENKAVSLQIKADKLYASAYKSLYATCQDLLNQSAVSYGENDDLKNAASGMMNDADTKRDVAKNTKNIYEKASLLNDAAGLEAAAIDNLIAAVQIQNGITPSEPTQTYTNEPNTEYSSEPGKATTFTIPESYERGYGVQQKSENLAIDQNIISKYEEYVNDPSIPDPIVINRSGVVGVDDVSVDNARNIIHDYRYESDYTLSEQNAYTSESQSAIEDSINQLTIPDQESEGISTETYETPTDLIKEPSAKDVTREDFKPGTQKEDKERSAYNKNKYDSRAALDLSVTPQSSDITFMVQVAASRIPLTRSQVWAIFPGNFTIEVVREDGWYKYRVTGFRLYSEANRVAMESGVRDAWVLSYQQGKQVNLPDARDMTRVLESDVKRYGRKALKDQTDYYVQVIASKTRLNDDQIRQFCGVAGLCREIVEEGWFKYQIYAGTEYEKALNIKNQLAGNSFIVAYERGTKVNLHKTINKNK